MDRTSRQHQKEAALKALTHVNTNSSVSRANKEKLIVNAAIAVIVLLTCIIFAIYFDVHKWPIFNRKSSPNISLKSTYTENERISAPTDNPQEEVIKKKISNLNTIKKFYNSLNTRNIHALDTCLSENITRYDSWKNKPKQKLLRLIKNHYSKIVWEKDSIHENTISVKYDNYNTFFTFKSTYQCQLRSKRITTDHRLNQIKLNAQGRMYYYNSMTID
jgi:hypothetical protein